MRILVTGGAGFIGSNFVRESLIGDKRADLDSLVVLDSLTYAGNLENLRPVMNDPRFKFVKGDIRDAELVRSLIKEVDAVVHFAAESHVDRSIESAHEFIETNVLGTFNLLDACRRQATIRFVHVSTDEVYGSIPDGSWDENQPLLPNSPYAASKASSDLIVRSFIKTHGVDAVITRCSNNYGPYQFPEKVIPLFITNLIDGNRVPLYGNGLNQREWIHVDDHCRAIRLVLERGVSGEIYNIGSGVELSNIELTNLILDTFGCENNMIEYVEDRAAHDLRYSVDSTKAAEHLGFHARISIADAMPGLIEWYRNNQEWWRPLKRGAT